MADVLWILSGISLLAAVVTGVLGFLVYPAQVRKQPAARGKKTTPAMERQGLSRSLFMIAVASAFTTGFFAIFLG